MRFFRLAWIVGCLSLLIALTACSDVFRPIAIPIFNPSGDPQVTQRAVVVNNNNNGAGGAGTVMIVDAAADVTLAVLPTGTNPVHANTISNNTWVANKNDSTLTVVNNFASGGTTGVTVTLPASSGPQFVMTTDPATVYVAEADGHISSVNASLLVVNKTVATGTNPVWLAELPDFTKVYSINNGSNDVSVFNSDLSPAPVPNISVGTAPIAAAFNGDGSLMFVLNQGSNNVSVIDTKTDTVTTTLAVGSTASPNPSAIVFDRALRRLYVANKAENSVTVFRADVGTPTLLKNIPLTGTAPVALTALANGTRVYVANNTSNNVSVIDTTSNTETKLITVGTKPVSITSGGGSIRVLVANSGSNNISDIQTSNDTVIATLGTSSPNPGFVLSLQ